MDDPALEYNILEAVHETDGNLTQRHISQKLGRSLASVNFALRLLAVKGYIKISGANPRHLKYHLTPSGLLQKSRLAYDFLKRQSSMYGEVRKALLGKLEALAAQGVQRVAVYGWTPFTEAAILYLISEGIQVVAWYVEEVAAVHTCNRIPLRTLDEFRADCDALVLLEQLPRGQEGMIAIQQVACFPFPLGGLDQD
jgi:DNA-binding Lrp family transcriptional regulator